MGLIFRKEGLILVSAIILFTFFYPAPSVFPFDASSEGLLIFGPLTFLREKGAPKIEQVTFTISDLDGSFLIRLTNGTPDGTQRVSSALVRLNGKEIFKPSQFNQQVEILIRQVSLELGENLLEVELRSAPESLITIEIFRLPSKVCSIFGPHRFIRDKGKPREETVEFALSSQFNGPYLLTLTNGNPDGSNRVDSAFIKLNGMILFDQNDFNEQVDSLSREVSLFSSNTLAVELMGAPGDQLTIDISGYDHIPPWVTITSPKEGAIMMDRLITVEGIVDDPFASVSVNERKVFVSGDGRFTLEGLELSEGENRIHVVATDSCGNRGENEIKVILKKETQAPKLVFCAYTMGPRIAIVGGGECKEQAFARDVGSVYGETDEGVVSILINEILLPDREIIFNKGSIIWGYRDGAYFYADIKIPQLDGTHFVKAKAIDKDGDETEAMVSFIRDTVSPHLMLLSPVNGMVTNSSILKVTGKVDDSEALVRINGSDPLEVVNGYFEGTYSLLWEGENIFYVTATDLAGNTDQVFCQVIRDTQAPEVEIVFPEDGQAVNTSQITIKGTMIDANGDRVIVEVNGSAPEALLLSNSNFSGLVSLNLGQNVLIIKAIDKAGNATIVKRSVLLDLEPPNLNITSPKDGETVSGPLTIITEVDDSISGVSEVSIFVDSQLQATLKQDPYIFSVDTSNWTPGVHILTARAIDQAGNQTEVSISISILAPLTVEITSPTHGSTVNKTKTIIQGRIHNQSGEIGVAVNGILAEVQGDYFATQIPLQVGENVITAVAKRPDGLQGETSIVIHTQDQQEALRLIPSPESGVLDQSGILRVILKAEFLLPIPISSYSWDGDGDGIFEGIGTEGTMEIQYSSPGIYLPRVRVMDDQGNVYEEATVVNVFSKEEMDTLLKSKWEGMKTKLIDKDLSSAMGYFIESSREIYQKAFEVIEDELPRIVTEMREIEPIFIRNNVAEYRIRRLHQFDDGTEQIITYYIYFVKDLDGIWRIDRF